MPISSKTPTTHLQPNRSQPAQRFQPQQLAHTLKKQSWVVFIIVIIGMLLDWVFYPKGHFVIAKNVLAGALLAWAGQLIFAKIALGVTGYRQRRQIVHRFYMGHLIKWLFTLLGFAGIFIILTPLSALWVFTGFMVLQATYILLMYQFKGKND